jgi:hypothetical protein
METFDLKKANRELYTAKEEPAEITVQNAIFIATDGKGEPGGTGYQRAIERLYGVAYTMKFALKKAGIIDFKVPNLECLWFGNPNETPIAEWKWRLLIRIPEAVTEEHLEEAKRQLREKKGIDASAVRRIAWEEGRSLQALHVGPYDTVTSTYEKLWKSGVEQGLVPKETGHEVYLNDPRRTAPEKLKTIIRLPVEPGPVSP